MKSDSSPAGLILGAPLRGWSTPLEEAPDPVFAARMLGDGVAIDPTGDTLYAPCDAIVIAAPPSRHAVSLRAPNGAELLLHVGIDTVALGGIGFELFVATGDQVRTGDRLLCFDLDLLAQRAKSVLTPAIVTNSERFAVQLLAVNRALQVGEPWLQLAARSEGAAAPAAVHAAQVPGRGVITRQVGVALEHGIHARPAGLMAKALKTLAAEVEIVLQQRRANARSPIAVMALGVRHGDLIEVTARGADAAAAVTAIEALLRRPQPATVTRPLTQISDTACGPSGGNSADATRIEGVVASPGLALGTAFPLPPQRVLLQEQGGGREYEFGQLDAALESVRRELENVARRGPGQTASVAQEVALAHLELLEDPQLATQARELIVAGKSAAFAWRAALTNSMDCLRVLGDPRMLEREADLRDLETRVVAALTGQRARMPELPPRSILIAEDLLPSQWSELRLEQLAGVCLANGGPTSHVAIIAASTSVPMLVATGPAVLQVAPGTTVVLDAEGGCLEPAPTAERVAEVQQRLERLRGRQMRERSYAQRPGMTADGRRVQVFANVGSEAEAVRAEQNGAEGCGLLRTEFLFLERHSAPDEDEQTQRYQAIAAALEGRPVVIRTLDIGGDKPIPYLPLPAEANPALGLRGIRTSLWEPQLLRAQLRAILRVRPIGQCRILLPMISEPGEVRAVRQLLQELQRDLTCEAGVQVGAMIETPAAAVMADWIAREADFLSVGTNDLTQYVLAMDRGNPELAARVDGLHPAVLRLLDATIRAAHRHGRPVAVCGGLASDPVAVPLLLGLGVDELSVVPGAIVRLKALLAGLHSEACRQLALQALELETAEAVRALGRQAVAAAEQSGMPAEERQ